MRKQPIWLLLDSSGIGGIETHVTALADAFLARGWCVEIVLLSDHGEHPLQKQWDNSGLRVRTLSGGIVELVRAIRNTRPSLVHTHGYKAGILGRLAANFLRIPIVSTFHAGEPGTGKVRLYNQLDKLTAGLAKCIAVSEPIARLLPSSAHTIPNFVNLPVSTVLSEGSRVAFVGRLSYEKGPDTFLKVATSLPEAGFVVFGDGPFRSELENSIPPNCTFQGCVPNMSPHWHDIGLLCISSRHEGLPLVALEAMANGIPVAAFGLGALPDVIDHGENGWIASPGDLQSLIEHVESWIKLTALERSRMSLAARQTIEDRYSEDAILPSILDVYRSAIAIKSQTVKCAPAKASA